jgi:hypothetical protein
MIDFVSTRHTTDSQTAACARLLAAVIAQAIKDASTPLNTDERRQRRNLNCEARQAIHFLFGRDSVFPLYASLVGSSADAIRGALMDKSRSAWFTVSRDFSDGHRRVLGQRARLHAALASPPLPSRAADETPREARP